MSCICERVCVLCYERQVDTMSHLYNRSGEVVFEPNVFGNGAFKLSLFVFFGLSSRVSLNE